MVKTSSSYSKEIVTHADEKGLIEYWGQGTEILTPIWITLINRIEMRAQVVKVGNTTDFVVINKNFECISDGPIRKLGIIPNLARFQSAVS